MNKNIRTAALLGAAVFLSTAATAAVPERIGVSTATAPGDFLISTPTITQMDHMLLNQSTAPLIHTDLHDLGNNPVSSTAPLMDPSAVGQGPRSQVKDENRKRLGLQ